MGLDLEQMTDDELYELIEDAQTELGRRQTRDVFDRELAEVVKAARGTVIPDRGKGEPWEPAKGYQGVYFKGDIVTHEGRTWESNINNNAGEPGVSGWTEQVEEGEYLVWKQPGGYEDAYEPGVIVWYPDKGDQLYENVHNAGNAWEPGTPGSQWEPYTPDDDAS